MQFQVTGFREAQEKGSKFMVYTTRVQHPSGAHWTVPIRYSRYHEFYTQVSKSDKAVASLPFPPKSFFAPSSDKRKSQLDAFMTQLAPLALSEKGQQLLDGLLHIAKHVTAHEEEEKKAVAANPEEDEEEEDAIDEVSSNQDTHDDDVPVDNNKDADEEDAVDPVKEGDATVDGVAAVQSAEAAVNMISKICLNFEAKKAQKIEAEPTSTVVTETPAAVEVAEPVTTPVVQEPVPVTEIAAEAAAAPVTEAPIVVEAPVTEAPVVVEVPAAVEIAVEEAATVEAVVPAPVVKEAPVQVAVAPIQVSSQIAKKETKSSPLRVEIVTPDQILSPALVTKARPTFDSIDASTTDDDEMYAAKKAQSEDQKKRRNRRRAQKRKKAKKGASGSSGSDTAQPVSP